MIAKAVIITNMNEIEEAQRENERLIDLGATAINVPEHKIKYGDICFREEDLMRAVKIDDKSILATFIDGTEVYLYYSEELWKIIQYILK